jgi:Fe-S cluster assembly protein SufD
MSEQALKNINKSPVRTWRWLGVNDISIEGSIPGIKSYSKEIIKEGYSSNVELFQVSGKSFGHNKFINSIDDINGIYNALPLGFESSEASYGISEELISLAKKKHNTGMFLRSIRNEVVEKPVIINYESDMENDVIIDNNIIIAEENSRVSVILNYRSLGGEAVFRNGLTRIYAAANSEVSLIKIQLFSEESSNFDSNLINLQNGAKVNIITVELGSKNTVVNYVNELIGEGCEANLSSIYLGDKEKTIDLNYNMNHQGKKTISNIEVNGALMDKSKKIFRGTLDFKRGASGSKGSEEEYAVLLSPQVRNRAVPLLLCSEEDVEGAHAASAGKIDEDMLFYIMSRGFSEGEAKKLIIESAFNPILEKIPVEAVREEINIFIKDKLK